MEVLCAGSSAELDAVLRAWEREYDDHVRESARRHLSVLRPEVWGAAYLCPRASPRVRPAACTSPSTPSTERRASHETCA